jgi:hypothetical protein
MAEETPQTFHRHPYTQARYGALGVDRVRVEHERKWGLFSRNADWVEGPLRIADPIFARWVTGKFMMEAVLERAGQREHGS